METLIKKRPTSVTVIGWIFIVVAVLMILGGAMGLVAFSFIHPSGGSTVPPMPKDVGRTFAVMSIVFQYFGLLASLQIVFAIFILIAGIQFLKLRAWARIALEIVSYLGLIYTVGFGTFWVVSWISVTSRFPVAESTVGPPALFNIFGAVMGIVVIAVCVVPLIVIIKFLRGETIKEAVSHK